MDAFRLEIVLIPLPFQLYIITLCKKGNEPFYKRMMDITFYKFIAKGNDKVGGVLYAPPGWPYPIAEDGEEVMNWKSLVVELKYGKYRHFQLCTGGANMVSVELKTLIESFIDSDPSLEFLPVKATSEEYGDKEYYIMHFKKIFDVTDKENTVYFEATDTILKLRLDYAKVKNLKVFNSQPAVNDIIVSEDVCKAIKKNKLDLGLGFMPVYCVNG